MAVSGSNSTVGWPNGGQPRCNRFSHQLVAELWYDISHISAACHSTTSLMPSGQPACFRTIYYSSSQKEMGGCQQNASKLPEVTTSGSHYVLSSSAHVESKGVPSMQIYPGGSALSSCIVIHDVFMLASVEDMGCTMQQASSMHKPNMEMLASSDLCQNATA